MSRLKDASDKPFDAYLKRLRNMGYFKDYLENSKKYNELLKNARESFRLNESMHVNPVDTQAKNNTSSKSRHLKTDKVKREICKSIYRGFRTGR
jgi:hypothetical protein